MYDWKHIALEVSVVGAAVTEGIAQMAQSGAPLPWHITAGTLLAIAGVLGHITSDLRAGGAK